MIASIQIIKTKLFAFRTALVIKLLCRIVFYINRKNNKNFKKLNYILRKLQISWVNYRKLINSWNAKFSEYFWNT